MTDEWRGLVTCVEAQGAAAVAAIKAFECRNVQLYRSSFRPCRMLNSGAIAKALEYLCAAGASSRGFETKCAELAVRAKVEYCILHENMSEKVVHADKSMSICEASLRLCLPHILPPPTQPPCLQGIARWWITSTTPCCG